MRLTLTSAALLVVLFPLDGVAKTPVKEKQAFLFVQVAESGTLVPKDGTPGRYVLTLNGVSPQTVYFSDRPARVAGRVTTDSFLKGLGFSDKNPPNAAVEVAGAAENEDVIIVELRRPLYNIAKKTLQYEVTILPDAKGGLAFYNQRRDAKLAREISNVTLFIDDCGTATLSCSDKSGKVCGTTAVGMCWHGSARLSDLMLPEATCQLCGDLSAACTKVYPTCPVWKELESN